MIKRVKWCYWFEIVFKDRDGNVGNFQFRIIADRFDSAKHKVDMWCEEQDLTLEQLTLIDDFALWE